MVKSVKIAFLGPPAVGKSSIINRVIGYDFLCHYYPTMGIKKYIFNDWITIFDFSGCEYNINKIEKIKNKLAELDINLIFYVCDCTNKLSFMKILYLRRKIKNISNFIISNKSDLIKYAHDFGEIIDCISSAKKDKVININQILK